MIDDKALKVSRKLFSDNTLIELVMKYFSKLSYYKHRLFCSKFCRGEFDSDIINDAVEYVYSNLVIVNRIVLPKERILRIYHEFMIYCIEEKIPDGERLPFDFFCDFTYPHKTTLY